MPLWTPCTTDGHTDDRNCCEGWCHPQVTESQWSVSQISSFLRATGRGFDVRIKAYELEVKKESIEILYSGPSGAEFEALGHCNSVHRMWHVCWQQRRKTSTGKIVASSCNSKTFSRVVGWRIQGFEGFEGLTLENKQKTQKNTRVWGVCGINSKKYNGLTGLRGWTWKTNKELKKKKKVQGFAKNAGCFAQQQWQQRQLQFHRWRGDKKGIAVYFDYISGLYNIHGVILCDSTCEYLG